MHEIRVEVAGRVSELLVDEGQLVAEEDLLLVLDVRARSVVIATDVPGVVRELHVDVGSVVEAGDLVALIDEA